MVLWILAGCAGPIGDHCVTSRDPAGDIRIIAQREMRGDRLSTETLYFAIGAAPAAIARNTYVKGEWVREGFDADPAIDTDETGETLIRYDEQGRVIAREVYRLPDEALEQHFQFEWDGDRVASTTNSTPFADWTETWVWDGDSARVEQRYDSGRVIVEFREYAPSVLTWPVLSETEDLPFLAYTAIGADNDGSGAIEPVERVWEREVDADGIPITSRFFDTTGSVITETEWGECP